MHSRSGWCHTANTTYARAFDVRPSASDIRARAFDIHTINRAICAGRSNLRGSGSSTTGSAVL